MAVSDKDHVPLDEHGLAVHIATALAMEAPAGFELDLSYKIVQRLFKPMIVGQENIPEQPCLFVGNHSLFALDGFVLGPLMQKKLGRFIRGLGDRFLFANPGIGDFVMKRGAVMGHPEVCSALMKNGSDLIVFPGGAHEAVKCAKDIYSLQWKERYGFVKMAAMHGYTIMPFGIVGPDEFYGHYMEGHEIPDSALGKLLTRLGLLTEDTRPDMMPPIPVGALGSLFPKPQRCYLGFGKPIDLARFEGKKLSKKNMQMIRSQAAGEIEEQLSELLLLREQHSGEDGLLRRILTR